jgi:hypothetical protein
MCTTGCCCGEPLPDVARLTDAELKEAIVLDEANEQTLAASLSVVRGKLEILRAERRGRLRRPPTHVDISGAADALLRRWLPGYTGQG